MSAQAGILFPRDVPLPSSVCDTLSIGNDDRGPHKYGVFRGDGVALIHHALHFDRLSQAEQQPVHLPDGAVLTFDGRLDNRDDLLLQLDRSADRDTTDADLASAAWRQWGHGAFCRLVGDWSLAIWLPADRTIVLARDYMGNRPLYYVHHGHAFAWSTCLHPLVEMFDLYDRLSDHYIAGALTDGTPPTTTPFAGVFAIPSGHWTEFNHERGLRHHRYWDFSTNAIRYHDDREYEEHLRAVFSDAVAVRLRAHKPAWTHLSGGYDSSAIACVATHLVRANHVEAPEVRFISRVFNHSPESDESPYIAAVESWCGQQTTRIDDRRETSFEDMGVPFAPFGGPRPDAPSTQAVVASGGHTIISGEMGDLVMAKSTQHAAALLELLGSLRIREFLRDFQLWSEGRRRPWWSSLLTVADASFPRLGVWRQGRKSCRRMANAYGTARRPRSSAYGLTSQLAIYADTPPAYTDIRRFRPSKRPLVEILYRCAQRPVVESFGGPVPTRLTYPFAHRPLVEFVLAIPHTALWRATESRSLMRRAFAGFMPPAVLARQGKGSPLAAITRIYRPLVQELLAEPAAWQLVSRGYMQDRALRHFYENFVSGAVSNPSHIPALVALEGWLRGTDGRRARLRSRRRSHSRLQIVS